MRPTKAVIKLKHRTPHSVVACSAEHGPSSTASSKQATAGGSQQQPQRTPAVALPSGQSGQTANGHHNSPPSYMQPQPQQPQQWYPPSQGNRQPQPQQQQSPQQQQTGAGSSNGSSMLQSLMQKPVKLLDTALRKITAESNTLCAGCGKSVGFGPVIRALGQQWHPQCFRCAGCSQPLTVGGGNSTFAVGQDGEPYHSNCHKQLFHPKCGVCHDYIPVRSGRCRVACCPCERPSVC